jgi:hypothetical protein
LQHFSSLSFRAFFHIYDTFTIIVNNSGGGMPMGYGGYSSQPMDHQNPYGGAASAYGSMGMMGANAFQGGMPMG